MCVTVIYCWIYGISFPIDEIDFSKCGILWTFWFWLKFNKWFDARTYCAITLFLVITISERGGRKAVSGIVEIEFAKWNLLVLTKRIRNFWLLHSARLNMQKLFNEKPNKISEIKTSCFHLCVGWEQINFH